MRFAARTILLLSVCLGAAACLKPSGERARPSPLPGEQSTEEETPAPDPTTVSGWQRVRVTILIHPDQVPRPGVVGFDQVIGILRRDTYGPCTSCHARDWPYLSPNDRDAWERFLSSLGAPGHSDTTSKVELAALLVSCIDLASEEQCAGDPTTPDDNLDYKMPSKFGFDPMTEDDTKTLRQWLAAGAPETSQDPRVGIAPHEISAVRLTTITPETSEARLVSTPLTHLENGMAFDFEARFTGRCSDGRLRISMLAASGAVLADAAIPILCDGNALVGATTISL